MLYRMLSSMPGLYTLDASTTHPWCDKQKCLQIFLKGSWIRGGVGSNSSLFHTIEINPDVPVQCVRSNTLLPPGK